MASLARRGALFTSFALLLLFDSAALAALTGSELVMRSTGFGVGTDWTLAANGYVGTYITLDSPGPVTLSTTASGTTTDAVAPRMNFAIADTKVGFDVGGGFNTYEHTFDLPAGTYFVRTEFNNDVPTADRRVTVRDLEISGATVRNSHELGPDATEAMLNFLALESADTYIQNFRRGDVTVVLDGLAPGASVDVSLKRHAFNFGTAVPGGGFFGVNNVLGTNGTALQNNYQTRLNRLFNAIVPENAGKWANNEAQRDNVQIANIDLMLDYAEAHNMRARMHNLIWGDGQSNGQQPGWVLNNTQNGLLDQADLGGSATAAADMRAEISERIDYYVGDGPGGREDHSARYVELDVYNESYHTGELGPPSNYWHVYGPSGVADIYRETKEAIVASGGKARLFVNEYSVLGSDDYADWYMRHIESIRSAGIAAGYGDVVEGIGAQYYPNSAAAHAPGNVMQTMQNLSVQGLPIALTEFGVAASVDQASAATILEDMLRLTFGNANATGFFMWGFHQGGGSNLFLPGAALYTVSGGNWTITRPGNRYEWLFGLGPDPSKRIENPNPWDTQLTAMVDESGAISFEGFWGDYELETGGRTYRLELVKGTSQYRIAVVPEPACATLVAIALALSARRPRNRTSRNQRDSSPAFRFRWHTCRSKRP
jgi:GH35 family endo-1,4-beta-xylanase